MSALQPAICQVRQCLVVHWLQFVASSKSTYNFVENCQPKNCAGAAIRSSIETYLHKVMQQLHKLQHGNNQTNVLLPHGTQKTTSMASFHSYLGTPYPRTGDYLLHCHFHRLDALYNAQPKVWKQCFTVKYFPTGPLRSADCFCRPQPDTGLHCKTTDTRPVRRIMDCLLPIIQPGIGTQCALPMEGWPGWVDLGGWFHTVVVSNLQVGHPSQY